jgi:hypothetical protein
MTLRIGRGKQRLPGRKGGAEEALKGGLYGA